MVPRTRYKADRSLLFNGTNAYVSRTPSVAGNRRTFTISVWLKKSSGASGFYLASGGGSLDQIYFDANERLVIALAGSTYRTSNQVFRDTSSWFHIVVSVDSTQSVAQDRIRVEVNGVEVTSWAGSSDPPLNAQFNTNNTNTSHGFGPGTTTYFNGYMSECYLVDGLRLDASYFGKFDRNGVWVPQNAVNAIRAAGGFGTNGVYLPFNDNTSTTTLGYDRSGNANHWTLNNLTTGDSVLDTPTRNFCTLNPLIPGVSTLSDGNLQASATAQGTFGLSSGRFYWEVTSGSGAAADAGIIDENGNTVTVSVPASSTYGFRIIPGAALQYTTNGSSWTSTGSAPQGEYHPYVATNPSTVNFGQRPFTYSVPAGYTTLDTDNLHPTVRLPKKQFEVLTYTGNGADNRTILGLEFQPDILWFKNLSNADEHVLVDSVRGVDSQIYPNDPRQATAYPNIVESLVQDGFVISNGGEHVNRNGDTFLALCMKRGTGIDIVQYTGTGVARTIAHNLGVVPDLIIVKNLTSGGAGANDPTVYHSAYTGTTNLFYRFLSGLGVAGSDASIWNDTLPTNSVFSVGSSQFTNQNGDSFVAYLFADTEGLIKTFTYNNNQSSNGPFIYTGFQPAFVMIKNDSLNGADPDDSSWYMFNRQRSPYNPVDRDITADRTDAETQGRTGYVLDFLSNGFKIRGTGAGINYDNTASGVRYLGVAFADAPLKYARAA